MTTKPEAFITSIRIEKGGGQHDYVTVWIRGANVGTLCVGKGDGEELEALLLPHASKGRPIPCAAQAGTTESVFGVEVRNATDEEQRLALERALPFVMKGPLAGAPHEPLPLSAGLRNRLEQTQEHRRHPLHDVPEDRIFTSKEAWHAAGCPTDARIVLGYSGTQVLRSARTGGR